MVQRGTGSASGKAAVHCSREARLTLCGTAQSAIWDSLRAALCGALAACSMYIPRWRARSSRNKSSCALRSRILLVAQLNRIPFAAVLV